MIRDFTLMKYRDILEAVLDSNYTTYSVHEYLTSSTISEKNIIFRHDVDRSVERTLDMAMLERDHGIVSTYYFRHVDDVFIPEVIQQVADMGHEIGYHYEVLDKAKGDAFKAIQIFEDELVNLRKHADISTICMHGNPFKKWSNRDLWDKYSYTDFGIIGEPYLSFDYNEIFYLTDTGRTWADLKIRVKDVVPENRWNTDRSVESIASTSDVISLIQSERIPQMCLLVHPNRWSDNHFYWTKELVMQNIKNIGKAGIIWSRKRQQIHDSKK